MKDLDFDELDRAVNSLMTNVPETRELSKPEEAEKTLDITPTLAIGDTPSFDKLNDATAKTAGVPTTQTTSPSPLATPTPRSAAVASRRGGRFMDVVHPSSDMKKPTIPIRPAVSRQGATIAPNTRTEVASQPLASPTPPPEKVLSGADVEPSTVSLPPAPIAHEQATSVSEWPDPLEMANFKDASVKSDMVVKSEESAPEEVQEPEEKQREEPSPLTSPFLSGTKVDKRPLGGNASDPVEELDRVPVFGARAKDELANTDPEAQLPATPVSKENELELPEELKGDLMAIEADTTTHHDALTSEKTDTSAIEKESEPTPKKPVHVSVPNPMLASQNEEKLLTAGPTSIPQQYREEPSTGDKDSGAIYDTDSYHQPLAHPTKKKSGWLWVLWIVVILILGAGGGAALYFFGIV